MKLSESTVRKVKKIGNMQPTLHEIPLGSRQEAGWEEPDEVTFERGLDYNGPDGTPETTTLSLDEAQQTLQAGLVDLHQRLRQRLVFERANPVTLSAEEKANVVTGLNFLLDEIHILQITVENILLTVDRGG